MDRIFKNYEDSQIYQLMIKLVSDNGLEREKAREAIVAKGIDMVDFLMELLIHPKHIYRWEAVKTLKEIGDPIAIPLFIRALEDNRNDVRWIASEGLIKLGKISVKPLLKVLIKRSDSVFILAGAHHIFYDLNENDMLPKEFPVDKLLSALKNPTWGESIKLICIELLNNLN
jgi:HEAT repeat protein